MSELSVSGVALRGISASVPSNREDNKVLYSLDEKAKKQIIEQVGIRYRHVASPKITASDLCVAAATKLLNELDWESSEIGLLVFVTQTPDYIIPGSATQIQSRLDLQTNCLALDVNQGCAGYVYGMSVVAGMMKSFGIKKALLLVGDTITRLVSPTDNSIKPIFSDAGSATAFELDETAENMKFSIGSNGKDFQAIHVPSGGSRNPIDEASIKAEKVASGVERAKNQLGMNGQAVFTFGLSTVATQIKQFLRNVEIEPTDLDYLVLHQANQFLNDSIARKTGFTKHQTPSSLYNFGNTSCATIPITLVTQLSKSLSATELKLLLSGFGVGLSWGNVILTTNKVVCTELIYL